LQLACINAVRFDSTSSNWYRPLLYLRFASINEPMAARPVLKLKPLPPLLPAHSNPRRVHPSPHEVGVLPGTVIVPDLQAVAAQDSAVEIGDLKRRRHDLTMESRCGCGYVVWLTGMMATKATLLQRVCDPPHLAKISSA